MSIPNHRRPLPDLSLPPKPPTPNDQGSISLPSTPPNSYLPHRSSVPATYQATTPDRPVFSPIPPWRLRKTQRANYNTQFWTPVPYATQSPSYPYQPSYNQPYSSPLVPASPSPAPRHPGTSKSPEHKRQHPGRKDRRKKAQRRRQANRLEASSPLLPVREAVEQHPLSKYSPNETSLEKYTSEEPTSAMITEESQAAKMPSDPLRDYLNLCQRTHKKEFSPNEQAMLCRYIDATKEVQRDMVYYLVTGVPWRNLGHSLTYKLIFWIYTRDRNYAIVAKMLRARLGDFDPLDHDLMCLDEIDELIDCQLVIDACRAGQDLSSCLAQLLQH
ncbi:hypothetical protein F4820DRAFT_446458 [Hypoxylon rubiginosum]|uniref:Uncharacterized protein n=1 Tax=Hypoxylon rubiginosum TaxID=110542 RepID=A0ACB9Z674_9PEZI|nr:hypothetical protein F4820DRAFT_446458 [Hypoxylon rubiginosum]